MSIRVETPSSSAINASSALASNPNADSSHPPSAVDLKPTGSNELPSYRVDDISPSTIVSLSNDSDFDVQSKKRHLRRLQDRWRCKVIGHSYCFYDEKSLHILLTEEQLSEWVDEMVRRT